MGLHRGFKNVPLPSAMRKGGVKKQSLTLPPSRAGLGYSRKLQKLWNDLHKNTGMRIKYPLIGTARHFDQLLKDINGDTERLDSIVDWYISHHYEEWIPKALTGEGFYWKFASIENAMKKWQIEHPTIKIKRKFKEMAANSFGVIAVPSMIEYWSADFVRLFPLALQITHNNYLEFSNWICTHYAYKEVYQQYLSHPSEFTIQWWKDLDRWFLIESHRKINPLSLVFDFDNNKTNKWIYSWSNANSFAPDTPRKLAKEFKECKLQK